MWAPKDATRRRRVVRASTVALTVAATWAASAPASAQLRADGSLQLGVAKRFTSAAPAGSPGPQVGPAALLVGHVAVIPLLRAGPYASLDVSPVSAAPARRIVSLGARARLDAPWATPTLHGYAFVGGGVALAHQGEGTLDLVTPVLSGGTRTETARVAAASGAFAEVPFGLGLAIRVRRPLELVFEAGGRAGFAFGGELYSGRTATSPLAGPQLLAPAGKDAFTLFFSAGVGLDR